MDDITNSTHSKTNTRSSIVSHSSSSSCSNSHSTYNSNKVRLTFLLKKESLPLVTSLSSPRAGPVGAVQVCVQSPSPSTPTKEEKGFASMITPIRNNTRRHKNKKHEVHQQSKTQTQSKPQQLHPPTIQILAKGFWGADYYEQDEEEKDHHDNEEEQVPVPVVVEELLQLGDKSKGENNNHNNSKNKKWRNSKPISKSVSNLEGRIINIMRRAKSTKMTTATTSIESEAEAETKAETERPNNENSEGKQNLLKNNNNNSNSNNQDHQMTRSTPTLICVREDDDCSISTLGSVSIITTATNSQNQNNNGRHHQNSSELHHHCKKQAQVLSTNLLSGFYAEGGVFLEDQSTSTESNPVIVVERVSQVKSN
jgi:hypothetical protein